MSTYIKSFRIFYYTNMTLVVVFCTVRFFISLLPTKRYVTARTGYHNSRLLVL